MKIDLKIGEWDYQGYLPEDPLPDEELTSLRKLPKMKSKRAKHVVIRINKKH